jgi:ankyrin repeat protein
MLLNNKKIKINLGDDKGRTPLHHAIRRNHIAIIKILLKSGAKPDVSLILNLLFNLKIIENLNKTLIIFVIFI